MSIEQGIFSQQPPLIDEGIESQLTGISEVSEKYFFIASLIDEFKVKMSSTEILGKMPVAMRATFVENIGKMMTQLTDELRANKDLDPKTIEIVLRSKYLNDITNMYEALISEHNKNIDRGFNEPKPEIADAFEAMMDKIVKGWARPI